LPDEAKPNQPPKVEEGDVDDDTKLDDDGTQDDPTKEVTDPKLEEGQVDPKAKVDGKPGKQSPWKLVESYKAKNRQLEAEVAEFRTKASAPGELPKELQEQVEAIKKRNAELENEIGFVNYRKSKEFVENFEKPYNTAWREALSALEGLSVKTTNPQSGEETHHPLSPQDIAHLANLDPKAARDQIRHFFPDDYAEVKSHVDKIRSLANAQNERLKEYESKGGDWEKQRQEQAITAHKAMAEQNMKLWKEVNDEAISKYEFLRPVDGDEVRNDKLAKSTSFVDEAMRVSASDPKLSPEERKRALKIHSAVRNRAIGFGVLAHENKSLKAKVTELEKALADFQASQPTNGHGRGQEGQVREVDTLDQALGDMEAYFRKGR